MKEHKFKYPGPFRLNADDLDGRATVAESIGAAIAGFPEGRKCNVVFQKIDETRNKLQNRLWNRWCREYAEHAGHSGRDYVHGVLKNELVLPIKCGVDPEKFPDVYKRGRWERAFMGMFKIGEIIVLEEREVKLTYDHIVGLSFDNIRSKNLPVKVFGQCLEEFQRKAADDGCPLQSRSDLEREEMMKWR